MRPAVGLRLTCAEARTQADIEHALLRIDHSLSPGLVEVRELIGQLLRLDHPQAHAFEESTDGVRTSFLYTDVRGNLVEAMDASLAADGSSGWAAFELLSPDQGQRNRALRFSPEQVKSSHAMKVLRGFGLGDAHQLRALICEGQSLLAWVGGYRADAFGERDVQLLDALVPSLHRRLSLERELDTAALTRRTLELSLELLGRAAFVVAGARARIVHANRAGLQHLEGGRAALRRKITEAAHRPDPAFEVHSISGRSR